MLKSVPTGLRRVFKGPSTRRSLTALAVKFSSIPIALGVNIVLARVLSVDAYGVYAVALSVFMIAAMPVISALSNLSIREISTGLASPTPEIVIGVIAFCGTVILIFSALYASLLTGLQLFSVGHSFSATIDAIQETVWMYPMFLFLAIYGACLRGMHRVILGALPEQVLRQAVFLLLLVCAFFFADAVPNAAWALTIQTVAMFVTAIFTIGLLWSVTRREVGLLRPKYDISKWRASLFPFLVLGLVQIGNSQMGITLLGVFNLSSDAAFYRVSDQLSGLALLPLLAVSLAIGPSLSKLHVASKQQEIQDQLTSSSKLIWLLTFPAILLLFLIPEYTLSVLFGEQYREAAGILMILCLGAGFNAALGPTGLTLNMLGHERQTLKGMKIALVTNIILTLILVPLWGGLGAALAATGAKIVWNIVLFNSLYKLEGYSTLPILIKPRLNYL